MNNKNHSIPFDESHHKRTWITPKNIAFCGALLFALVMIISILVYMIGLPGQTYSKEYASTMKLVGEKQQMDRKGEFNASGSETDLRLPNDLRPLSYAVQLQPFLNEGNFTFQGHVKILIECKRQTKQIILHALKLNISRETVQLTNSEGKSLAIDHPQFVSEKQFLIFNLHEELRDGSKYMLAMNYAGQLTSSLAGFYRSKYGDKWMATTQLAATDARRVFPCFDEPGFKAVFNVTLVRHQDMISLSNMPLINSSSDVSDEWIKDQFLPTKTMSTYLLAFIVTDFDYNEKTTSGVQFRVYSRKEAINQTHYALKIGSEILSFYEELFNVSYPLPKLDMIAVPDMGPNAMENWGLITYREAAVLFNPKIASSLNRQSIAVIVAHELAHQWFGNLVTPLWWQDLWLNEGFASYVEYLGVNKVHPEWNMLDQFVVEDLHDVFQLDSLESSHPVFVPVDDPDKISEIFDQISYEKGASITRMMHHFLGNDIFSTGLMNYLTDKKFDNAVQDDLWDHLTRAAVTNGQNQINVKTIMDTWTLQPGYPVVNVRRNNDSTVTLDQARFLLVDSNSTVEDSAWEIPITFTTASAPDFSDTRPIAWMHQDGKPITLSEGVPDASSWVIFNLKQSGFFRVNYDIKNWKLLIDQLKNNHTAIDPVNRAQIINDAFNLARADLLSYDVALSTIQYLASERDYVPIRAAYDATDHVSIMLSNTGAYGKWKKYLLSTVTTLYHTFKFNDVKHESEEDWKDEEHLISLTRAMVVKSACKLGMKECLNNTLRAFSQWKDSNISISPNLKKTAICTALQQGDVEEWEFIWHQYLSSTVSSEKVLYLETLGCTTKPWLLSRYLEMTLTSDKIRAQDVANIFRVVARNEVGRCLAYDFVRDKWMQLKDKFEAGLFSLARILRVTFSNLNTRLKLKELYWFKKTYEGNLSLVAQTLSQIIEETEANVQWMSRNCHVIEDWLNKEIH